MRTAAIITSVAALMTVVASASAVTSAEIYTSQGYQYGRFSARIQYASGSGVVSSFFLWKDGSEQEGVFWNELDFEKLEAECRLETNTLFGDPLELDPGRHTFDFDLCNSYHVYSYEWTPEYIAWFVDGEEIRRVTGDTANAYRDNTADVGMQLRFNVWPGDATFGGEFDPAVLPVYQYIDWVEYESYADGQFKREWREDFTANTLPSGWLTGSWESPKNNSTHSPANVVFKDGYVVLALTADDATGADGVNPRATDDNPSEPSTPTPVDPSNPQPTTPTPTDPVPTTDPGNPPPGTDTPAPTAPGPTPEPGAEPTTPNQPAPVDPTNPAPTTPGGEPTTDPNVPGAPTTGAPTDGTDGGSGDEAGCACKITPGATNTSAVGLMGFLLAALGWRRTRRSL